MESVDQLPKATNSSARKDLSQSKPTAASGKSKRTSKAKPKKTSTKAPPEQPTFESKTKSSKKAQTSNIANNVGDFKKKQTKKKNKHAEKGNIEQENSGERSKKGFKNNEQSKPKDDIPKSRFKPKAKAQNKKKILPADDSSMSYKGTKQKSKKDPEEGMKQSTVKGGKSNKKNKYVRKGRTTDSDFEMFYSDADPVSDLLQYEEDTQTKKQKAKKPKSGKKASSQQGHKEQNYIEETNEYKNKTQAQSKKSKNKKKSQTEDKSEFDDNLKTKETQENSLSELSHAATKSKSKSKSGSKSKDICYEQYWPISKCLRTYNNERSNKNLIRGKIRIMPGCGGWSTKKDKIGFVSCDRGSIKSDVVIKSILNANRALDGDVVYVLLDEEEDDDNDNIMEPQITDKDEKIDTKEDEERLQSLLDYMKNINDVDEDEDDNVEVDDVEKDIELENVVKDIKSLDIQEEADKVEEQKHEIDSSDSEDENAIIIPKLDTEEESDDESQSSNEAASTWRDDALQRKLWDPVHNTVKPKNVSIENLSSTDTETKRRTGKVVFVVPPSGPNDRPSSDSKSSAAGVRVIVGTLQQMGKTNNRVMFTPNNRSLPRFVVQSKLSFPAEDVENGGKDKANQNQNGKEDEEESFSLKTMYSADYKYGSWISRLKFPPCSNIRRLGKVYDVEAETMTLLEENGVNHGDFNPEVLKDVNKSVKSGLYVEESQNNETSQQNQTRNSDSEGWRPTPEMYKGRRDYTSKRIFTIDPTTARDLDDALHITPLSNDRVEIGVHIADVSHFLTPDTAVDDEAMRRGTTVYLVDRTVPMLPRPLCEIACSLNENVERLAFSCVWTMNLDGTLEGENEKDRNIWYGKTVIKSCARLDYSTAQNIIEEKVGIGEDDIDEDLWPITRRPTGVHTIEEVCADVRLMHRVAVARRKLRYDNGALALNGVKLAFELEGDGSSPKLCEPYPIRDSNRLIEEYMLLANFLVAQRLITHAGGLACLRRHPPPRLQGMSKVVDVARDELDFNIDMSNSGNIQESLSRLSRQCDDELALQCLTEMLTLPMNPAVYFAAGEVEDELWRHFALNIPYYCHFTSPIRRYPDVIVHRLLQATIEGDEALRNFSLSQSAIQSISEHCNEKKMSSKKASDRSDRVFLSIFLKKHPIAKALGVVVGVGEKTLTVFVPMLGLSQTLFLEDHDHLEPIIIQPKSKMILKVKENSKCDWTKLRIKTFTKIYVSCHCRNRPPINVVLRIVGPWKDESV